MVIESALMADNGTIRRPPSGDSAQRNLVACRFINQRRAIRIIGCLWINSFLFEMIFTVKGTLSEDTIRNFLKQLGQLTLFPYLRANIGNGR